MIARIIDRIARVEEQSLSMEAVCLDADMKSSRGQEFEEKLSSRIVGQERAVRSMSSSPGLAGIASGCNPIHSTRVPGSSMCITAARALERQRASTCIGGVSSRNATGTGRAGSSVPGLSRARIGETVSEILIAGSEVP